MLFAEWYQICELPGANDGPCNHYIIQLHQSGLLKGDDMTERFFRIITVNLPLPFVTYKFTRGLRRPNSFFVSTSC